MSAMQSMMGGGSNDAPPAGKKRQAAEPFQGSMNPGPFQIGRMLAQLCKEKGPMCFMSAMQSMMGGGSNDAPPAGKKRQAAGPFQGSMNPGPFQIGRMLAQLCKGKGPMCFMSAMQSMMGGGSNDAPPAGKKRQAAGPFQ